MSGKEKEESLVKYMEGYLHKKEDRKKWIEYWVVLERRYLMFHEHKPANGNINEHLIGWVELTVDSKCILAKKRGYSFPFYLEKRQKRYLFKTPCQLSRHKWLKAIEASVLGEPPQIVPTTLTDVNRNHASSVREKRDITREYIVEAADETNEKSSEAVSRNDTTWTNYYSNWEKPGNTLDFRDVFSEKSKYPNIWKSNTIGAPGRSTNTSNSIRGKIFSMRVVNPPLEEAVTLL